MKYIIDITIANSSGNNVDDMEDSKDFLFVSLW